MAFHGSEPVSIGRSTGVKTELAHSEGGGALQLLPQARGRPRPLFLVRRCSVQHVRRMHQHVPRLDAGLVQCLPETLNSFGTDGGLVAVVFWNRGKELQGLHPAVAGAESRLVDAAPVYCVRAQ